jgi:DNA-binding beta-propeller fold protein YncE
MPWGIGISNSGDVYVADWRNDRVQRFTSDGQFVMSYGSSGAGDGQLSRPSGVCVDSDGYVYVADWGNERVQLFDADGNFVQTLRGQATLSKWAQDFMSVNPDESNTREMSDLVPELPPHLDTPYLVSSQIEPYFWGPVSVRLDGEERLYVTESNRHRVQIYQRRKV